MTPVTDIGHALIAARRGAGISQRELGEHVGVRQQQIARWEADGYRTASLERLGRVADALGVEPASLAAEHAAAYGTPAPAGDRLVFDYRALAGLCRENQVARLELFGSVLRDDFGADSDVDVLVTFAEEARPTIFSLVGIEDEMTDLFGRSVDLVDRRSIESSENHIRREAILGSARVLYVA